MTKLGRKIGGKSKKLHIIEELTIVLVKVCLVSVPANYLPTLILVAEGE